MHIIPVIDLLDGHVVHAKRGQRQDYSPIQSILCNSSEPKAIVKALLELYPFEQLYIADINAIQKRGNHISVIADIIETYPKLEIWLDAGISDANSLDSWSALNINWVIGSESMSDFTSYLNLKNALQNHFTLSLDFSVRGFEGPIELLNHPNAWADKVIVMSLPSVGSSQGADMTSLEYIRNKNMQQALFAAGGVRSIQDLRQLKILQIEGALVATALHNGAISQQDIINLKLANT